MSTTAPPSAIRSTLLAAAALAVLGLSAAHAASTAAQSPPGPTGEGGAPLPPDRPAEFGAQPQAKPGPASQPGAAPDGKAGDQAVAAPLPPERPRDLETLPPPVQNRPVAKEDETPPGPDDEGCADRLARLGVVAKPLPPIENGACGAPRPYEVSGLPDGVTLAPPVTLTCPAAEALGTWSRDVVSAAADRELNAPAKRIAIGTSYECRSQNHQAGAKLSEHAFANGVDVSGFEFEKRASVTVGHAGPDTPEGRFAAAVRTGACRYFTTVLGPGANAEHADHLHLDLRARNRGYRICE
ncbi:extensin family protein [Alsobacter sp. KACC 23698]|uniref:Extensin family protein n=1 Tax=Alsobacter sp. KACC 23698 TaxID=3149229 RepID=A0AAU7JM59_9HYPH